MEHLYTIKHVAAQLAVSPEFLKKLQRNKKLNIIRLGRAVRISEHEVERLCRDGIAGGYDKG